MLERALVWAGRGNQQGGKEAKVFFLLSLCSVVMHFCFGRRNRRKATKGAISLRRHRRRRQQNSPICNLGTASSVRWVLSPFCRKGRRWAALTCRTDVALWRRRREKTGESFYPSYEKEKVMKRERDPTWSPRSHCPRSVLAPVELPTSSNICAAVSSR